MTQWLWTAANGIVTDLTAWSGGTYVIDVGSSGELAPTYEFLTQSAAGVDGEQLQQVNANARTTLLALDLVAADGTELRTRVRALAHAMRPRAGIGTLSAVADDGSVRTLPAYYRKGLEAGTYRVTRYRTVLEFWSPSPWWRGDQVTIAYGLAAPSAFFPILPIVLSPSTISGTSTIDLSGTDAPTYPRWTITGPGSQLTLTNTWQALDEFGALQTLTRSLVLTPPGGIGDGQIIVIDTRPGQQSVRRATGTPPAITEQRRNLVPNPAPSSANSYSANYGTGGAGALTYSGSGGPAGGGYVRASWTTASTATGSGQLRYDGRAALPLPIPVTPGQVLSAAAAVRVSIAQRLALVVTWFDASGSQAGISPTSAAGTGQVPAVNTWTVLTAEGITVPAGAAYCLIGPQAVAGTGAVVWPIGSTLDMAQTQLEVATAAGTYFDGSTASTAGTSYVWAGAPNASQSIMSSVVQSGALTLGDSLFGSLASDPALWPLVDGVQDVTALLTGAGAASRIAVVADRLYSGAR